MGRARQERARQSDPLVHRAGGGLVLVQRVRVQRGEPALGPGEVGDDNVRVQLRIPGAREPMPIPRGDKPVPPHPLGAGVRSYTQKLWMRVKRKAAYLPGC